MPRSWEACNPYAIVDEEDGGTVVARYTRLDLAEFHIGHLRDHGGTWLHAKVNRGGYGIDGPEEKS